jgi:hypothetical protein
MGPYHPGVAPGKPGSTTALDGVPHAQADDLAELLAYVRRHRDAGRPPADVRADGPGGGA